MSLVRVGVVAQMGTSLMNPMPYLTALISSLNGIYNPEFLRQGEQPGPRFRRVVTLMTDLTVPVSCWDCFQATTKQYVELVVAG